MFRSVCISATKHHFLGIPLTDVNLLVCESVRFYVTYCIGLMVFAAFLSCLDNTFSNTMGEFAFVIANKIVIIHKQDFLIALKSAPLAT